MVLSVTPSRSSTMTAVSSASGIAVSEMKAVRKCPRNNSNTTATSAAPTSSECSMLWTAASMNVAGRCSRGKSWMPSRANTGFRSASACSSATVTSMVLAPYWLAIVTRTPGRPMMSESPNFGSPPSATVATSRSRTGTPFVPVVTTMAPNASAVSVWPSVWSTTRWFSFSMNPAPRTPLASRAAPSTSDRARLCATSRSGCTWICHWRTSPPKILQSATPDTASSRGRRVQLANVRSCIGVSWSLSRPILSRSMVDEVSGDIFGAATPAGSEPAVAPSFSASSWRASRTLVPSVKTTVMTDKPWMDSERSDS
jgi:hypothetical protein